jgi:DNA-binding NarL/FixJ family response regulator
MPIRVVLAEDTYVVREGVRRLLERESTIDIVAVCAGLDELLDAVSEQRPDVVLTDVRMPPDHTDEGIRAAAIIRQRDPQVGVVVLSQFADARYALDLFELGAAGRAYLLKERLAHVDELVAAIHTVTEGGSVVDPTIVDALVAARVQANESLLSDLTPRERGILSEMAKGKNNAAIAATLGITERSLEKYIHSIFVKLELAWETDTHKRVKAVVVYLSGRGGDSGCGTS